MQEISGYRLGIPIIGLGATYAVVAAVFESIPQRKLGLLPTCLGNDALGDGFQFIDIFWTCPDGLRLAIMSFFAGLAILAVTWMSMSLAKQPITGWPILSLILRCGLAGLTVGIAYLIGVYISEFSGGQGRANLAFLIGMPLAISLMHFPGKWGVAFALPNLVLGFLGLVLVCLVTQIPLD